MFIEKDIDASCGALTVIIYTGMSFKSATTLST